jgi:hypothetical protein
VLHKPLLAAGTHKRRYHRLTSFCHPIRFHQEQFAFSQPEKGLATLLVCAVTQHVFETPFMLTLKKPRRALGRFPFDQFMPVSVLCADSSSLLPNYSDVLVQKNPYESDQLEASQSVHPVWANFCGLLQHNIPSLPPDKDVTKIFSYGRGACASSANEISANFP